MIRKETTRSTMPCPGHELRIRSDTNTSSSSSSSTHLLFTFHPKTNINEYCSVPHSCGWHCHVHGCLRRRCYTRRRLTSNQPYTTHTFTPPILHVTLTAGYNCLWGLWGFCSYLAYRYYLVTSSVIS